MKNYYILALASLLTVLVGCDRSDPSDYDVAIPEPPTFEETTAGKQAENIYKTYGIHCHWGFQEIDYFYAVTKDDLYTKYKAISDFTNMPSYLTFLEEKVLKLFPKEVSQHFFAHLYICDEVQNEYDENKSSTPKDNYAMTTTLQTELLAMKVKNPTGIALGFAGKGFPTADKAALQLAWIEAMVESMFNNTPYPTEFHKAAIFSVYDITKSTSFDTPYKTSLHAGWWFISENSKNKNTDCMHTWGLLDVPNSGLRSLRYNYKGELAQLKETIGYSTWYDAAYTVGMDFATYTAFLMLKPKAYMDDLCAKYPLIDKKARLVKEYFKANFNFDLPNLAK